MTTVEKHAGDVMSKGKLLGYRTYENDEICVFWNPELCEHARECIIGNAEVFDVSTAVG